MTVEKSHGKRRPRAPRPGEHAEIRNAVLAAPLRDPVTGHFLRGNKAGRLRTLKSLGTLATLDPAACAAWVRPYVELVQVEASALVEETGAEESESLKGFAVAAADAHAMYRALMAIALAPDTPADKATEARSEARAWLKEHRQSLLSLRAEARAGVPERPEEPHDLPPGFVSVEDQ